MRLIISGLRLYNVLENLLRERKKKYQEKNTWLFGTLNNQNELLN